VVHHKKKYNMPRIDLLQPRRGTAAEWTSANPILDVWEVGEETDTGKSKRGDGVTDWDRLDYWGAGGAVDSVNGEVGTVVLATDDIADSIGFRYTNDSDIQRLSTTTGTNTGDQDLSAIESRVVADTGSVIALTTIGGTASNFTSANTNTAFTINNTAGILFTWNEVLINTATEPVITGATQEGGIAWTTGDLYLIVVNRRTHVSYMYQSKSIGSGGTLTLEGYKESGVTADGTLNVFVGDDDLSGNGHVLGIFDDTGQIFLGETANGIGIDILTGLGTVTKNGNEIVSFGENWNATTNTPTLANTDTAVKALEYIVSVAGTQDFGAGNITFSVDDIIANDGTVWYKKVDNNQSGGGGKFVDGTDPLDAVYTTGNVGIGTLTPSEALDVVGNITASGNLKANRLDINGLDNFVFSDQGSYCRIQTFSGQPLALNAAGNNVGIGTTTPATKLEVNGAITQQPLSADPSDPSAGNSVQWVSDGTGSGDAGDVMMKINVGGTTKTITLVDYSAV
jgi:hypothetical protein